VRCVWRFWIKLSRFDFCPASGKLFIYPHWLYGVTINKPRSLILKPKLNYAPLWCLSGVYIHYKLRRSPQKLLSERGCCCAFAGLMKSWTNGMRAIAHAFGKILQATAVCILWSWGCRWDEDLAATAARRLLTRKTCKIKQHFCSLKANFTFY